MESENYVRIFTDSQATLQALHNPHVTSKLIEETYSVKPTRTNRQVTNPALD